MFMAIKAIVLVAGIIWCCEVIGRWRSDVEELRTFENDDARRVVIVGIWVVTAAVAITVAGIAVSLIVDIVSGVRGLL